MPVFEYKGKTLTGTMVAGELSAGTREELLRALRRKRVLVSEVKKKPAEVKIKINGWVRSTDVTRITRQLSTMIKAGLPLVQCLEIISSQASNERLKQVLNSVREKIQSGGTLFESLAKHPKIFDDLYVNMVEAGEVGGALDTILLRLATYREKIDSLRRKIRGAMIYPAVITVVALGATIFLITFIIPVFAKLFQDFKAELPAPTKLVLAISSLLRSNILTGIVALIILGIAFRYYIHTDAGRLNVDRLKLKIPILGNLIRKGAISRFSRTLGTLLSSGVPILDALEITSRTAGNQVVHDAIRRSKMSIAEGETITQPLKDTGVFPPMVTQMIAVGEKTGNLDNMLTKIADFYDEEVDAAVSALTSVIEPVIVVVMGFVIGFILIAMYLPMFDLIGAIS